MLSSMHSDSMGGERWQRYRRFVSTRSAVHKASFPRATTAYALRAGCKLIRYTHTSIVVYRKLASGLIGMMTSLDLTLRSSRVG